MEIEIPRGAWALFLGSTLQYAALQILITGEYSKFIISAVLGISVSGFDHCLRSIFKETKHLYKYNIVFTLALTLQVAIALDTLLYIYWLSAYVFVSVLFAFGLMCGIGQMEMIEKMIEADKKRNDK